MGSNPNETLAIFVDVHEDQLVDYCEDSSACNYGEIGDCQYSELYCNCDGNCVNDFDNDEIGDELELNFVNNILILVLVLLQLKYFILIKNLKNVNQQLGEVVME